MISAFEITAIILLTIGLGLVIWWYMEAANYDSMLDGVTFARGANLIYSSEEGANNTVKMSCPDGKQVCVYQATQICSNPQSGNFEDTQSDPIMHDASDKSTWSTFDPSTTLDLTADMNGKCGTSIDKPVSEGKCEYQFDPSKHTLTTNGTAFPSCSGGTAQLIATYTCEPAGATCRATA